MKILVTYDCDNGYSCSCCGRWWNETEEYDLPDNTDLNAWESQHEKEIEEANNNYGYGRRHISYVRIVDVDNSTSRLKNLIADLYNLREQFEESGYYDFSRDINWLITKYDTNHHED